MEGKSDIAACEVRAGFVERMVLVAFEEWLDFPTSKQQYIRDSC